MNPDSHTSNHYRSGKKWRLWFLLNILNIPEMTSLVYSGRNAWKAVTGWELGAPWIRSGCTSWTPPRLIRANTPWSYSMGTAPTNCPQTWLGKVSWGTAELLSRSPANPGQGFLSPSPELELISLWNWGKEDSEERREERGSGQEKRLKPLGSFGTAGERMRSGQLLLRCVQFLHWTTELTGGILERRTFTKAFPNCWRFFFLLWSSLWKERIQSHLFQQYKNRDVFP